MKKLLIVAVVLVAAVLAIPGVVGYQAEERYQALVEQLRASGVEVVENSYRRGWFGAEAVARIRLPAPTGSEPGAAPVELVLRSDIAHGPLTSQGVGLAEIETDLEADGKSLLAGSRSTVRTMIAVDGTGHTRIQVPEQELVQAPDAPTIRFLGLNGEIDFDLEREEADFRFRSPGIRVQQDGRSLAEVERLALDSRTWRGRSGLMLGEGKFQVGRVILDDPDLEGTLELRQLVITGESAEQGERSDLLSAAVEYRLASLDYQGQRYGDGLLRMAVSNLYAPVVLKIQETAEQIQRQRLSEPEMGMAMMSLLSSQAPDLLKRDPRVELAPIALNTPQGRVEAGFSLQAKGLTVADLRDQSRLLKRLQAEARLRLPEVLFREMLMQQNRLALLEQAGGEAVDQGTLERQAARIASGQIEQWLEQGLLQRDGKFLHGRAVLDGGRLRVNGREIPLPPAG